MNKNKGGFLNISNISSAEIWFAVFLYSVCMAVFVQFIIMPYVFPSLDNGEGLIKGLDSTYFNQIAVQLSEKIRSQGWSAWELSPAAPDQPGQVVAGVVAAIYALTIPKPWVLIPINAALHATSSLLLFLIIFSFFPDRKKCFLSILPFVLYPTAALWVSQIHKDNLFITGIFSFILGLTMLSRIQGRERKWPGLLQGYILMFLGVFSIWAMRPYCVKMIFYITILISIILSIALLLKIKISFKSLPRHLFAVLLIWVPLVLIQPFLSDRPLGMPVFAAKQSGQPQVSPEPQKSISPAEKGIEGELRDDMGTIIRFRLGSARTGGRSLVDSDVSFKGTIDIMKYLPRLIQISFLAPFPNMWFVEGTTLESTIMRRVSAFEMMGVYFFLPFFLVAVWSLRRRIDFWVSVLFAAYMLLIFGFAVINIGTFYRMRYCFIMLFVSFGILGFSTFLQRLRKRPDNK